MNIAFDLLEWVSLAFLGILLPVTALLLLVYVLDVTWNLVRAIHDPKRGWSYYFSDEGPEN